MNFKWNYAKLICNSFCKFVYVIKIELYKKMHWLSCDAQEAINKNK